MRGILPWCRAVGKIQENLELAEGFEPPTC